MHHFAEGLVYIADAVMVQPLLKIIGLRGYKPYYLLILQADDKCVDGKNVGRQFCRVVVKTRKAGGETVHVHGYFK